MDENMPVPETAAEAEALPTEAQTAVPKQTDAPEAQTASDSSDDADFESLIRGKYKGAFEERVKRIIDRRFREARALARQAEKTQPILDLLKKSYGETDEDALLNRLTSEGIQKPSPLRAARLRAREKGAEEILKKWNAQTEDARRFHPTVELRDEIRAPRFRSLLLAGVDVKTAYEVLHAEELMADAMRYAAERTRERTVSDIRARGLRPMENGADGRGATRVTPPRVSDMTRAQREEIERRCARGEKVYFA